VARLKRAAEARAARELARFEAQDAHARQRQPASPRRRPRGQTLVSMAIGGASGDAGEGVAAEQLEFLATIDDSVDTAKAADDDASSSVFPYHEVSVCFATCIRDLHLCLHAYGIETTCAY
jgi:hypothetical protein